MMEVSTLTPAKLGRMSEGELFNLSNQVGGLPIALGELIRRRDIYLGGGKIFTVNSVDPVAHGNVLGRVVKKWEERLENSTK